MAMMSHEMSPISQRSSIFGVAGICRPSYISHAHMSTAMSRQSCGECRDLSSQKIQALILMFMYRKTRARCWKVYRILLYFRLIHVIIIIIIRIDSKLRLPEQGQGNRPKPGFRKRIKRGVSAVAASKVQARAAPRPEVQHPQEPMVHISAPLQPRTTLSIHHGR